MNRPIDRAWVQVAVLVVAFLVLAGAAYAVAAAVPDEDVSRPVIAGAALVIWLALLGVLYGFAVINKVPGVLTTIAALLVVVGGSALRVDKLLPNGPASENEVETLKCPSPAESRAAAIQGTVISGVKPGAGIRRRADLSEEAEEQYLANCRLGFSAYCIGQAVKHQTLSARDVVWYRLSNGRGWLPSAWLSVPNPPVGTPPTACPGSKDPPAQPEITAPTTPAVRGVVEISAAAPRAPVVGFATYYEDKPGLPESAEWHQLPLDTNPSDGVGTKWNTASVPGVNRSNGSPAILAAIPCLAINFPSDRRATRSYRVVAANSRTRKAVSLRSPPSLRNKAPKVACEDAG